MAIIRHTSYNNSAQCFLQGGAIFPDWDLELLVWEVLEDGCLLSKFCKRSFSFMIHCSS